MIERWSYCHISSLVAPTGQVGRWRCMEIVVSAWNWPGYGPVLVNYSRRASLSSSRSRASSAYPQNTIFWSFLKATTVEDPTACTSPARSVGAMRVLRQWTDTFTQLHGGALERGFQLQPKILSPEVRDCFLTLPCYRT